MFTELGQLFRDFHHFRLDQTSVLFKRKVRVLSVDVLVSLQLLNFQEKILQSVFHVMVQIVSGGQGRRHLIN